MLNWIRNRGTTDTEYLARCQRLKSEIEQSKPSGIDVNAKLDSLNEELNSLKNKAPSKEDLITVTKIEAEVCLFKPVDLLFPTYQRLKSKFYRFDQGRSTAWQADLRIFFPDSQTVKSEGMARQRLRQLTYELFEEAESYNRTAEEKSGVIFNLTAVGSVLLVILLSVVWCSITNPPQNALIFPRSLATILSVGAVGALTSTLSSIGREKARFEYLRTLIVQMIVRALLGSVYALVVYAAVAAQYLPIKIPTTSTDQLALFVLLAFAAGFSDRLFGQTVSQLISRGGASRGKSDGS